jgi:hypothetical protein
MEGNQPHYRFKIFHFLDLLLIHHVTITQPWLFTSKESTITNLVYLPLSLEVLEFILSFKKINLGNDVLTLTKQNTTHLYSALPQSMLLLLPL